MKPRLHHLNQVRVPQPAEAEAARSKSRSARILLETWPVKPRIPSRKFCNAFGRYTSYTLELSTINDVIASFHQDKNRSPRDLLVKVSHYRSRSLLKYLRSTLSAQPSFSSNISTALIKMSSTVAFISGLAILENPRPIPNKSK